jgi:hypothetical protein
METDKIRDKIASLLKNIEELGPMMRGSVTYMGKKNKQPYFSVGLKGKTKVMYLGDKRAEIAKEYVDNYKKMLDIVDEMTILNMELLKAMKTDGKKSSL